MTEKMKKQSNRSCDVLIIGGGSAGLRAAIDAHDAGAHVLMISKSRKGDPHTVLARGGINAALATMDPEDNWMIHAADTLREGEFLADYNKVEVLCKNAPEAINELVGWGARFHREKDGRLTQRFFGAHTYRRTVFYEDWTGKEIIRVLMDQVRRRKIVVDSNHLIFDSPYVDNVYTTTPFFEFRILIILSCYPLLSCICLSLSLSRLLVGDIRNAILQRGQHIPSWQ
ncbi:MAG: FAD-binding protein [Candidatus Nitrosopolaris sp.]